jgi:uncharacterized membrane protein
MARDTFTVIVGSYPDLASAESDYELVKELHVEADLMDAYDAAVIHRRQDGKVRIARKHETPTRVGGVLGGGAGLATGLVVALFPSPPSGADCWRPPPPAERSSGRRPGTRRPA